MFKDVNCAFSAPNSALNLSCVLSIASRREFTIPISIAIPLDAFEGTCASAWDAADICSAIAENDTERRWAHGRFGRGGTPEPIPSEYPFSVTVEDAQVDSARRLNGLLPLIPVA